MKLYEYLACGLPVVATSWQELAGLESPAVLCDGPAAFIAGIRRVLSEPFDAAAARRFAQGADWHPRVQALLDALGL